ncbi:hypothetical protein [Massilia sp. TWR1-2-2]|uniref:hypothetical protein n=1 Tax=Massilia sp. TWR1-2-2 TaxID=2804584 RepID=UPI003CF692E7
MFGTACLRLADEALCSSAAKKKEYEAFSSIRQLLFFLRHPFRSAPTVVNYLILLTISSGRRTIANGVGARKFFSGAANDRWHQACYIHRVGARFSPQFLDNEGSRDDIHGRGQNKNALSGS